VRLQEIAADVGVSHPLILHHFGSRERLLAALAERAMRGLGEDLLAILATRRPGDSPASRAARVEEMFEAIHRLFGRRGYARLLAGLIVSGHDLRKRMRGVFGDFVRAMHENRVQRRTEAGRPSPSWEDTTFSLTTAWITLFGDALFGPIVRAAVDLPDDDDTNRRFRRWLAHRFEGASGAPMAAQDRPAPRRRPRRSS
jgi:AcrR family transcriptional regulator